MQARQCGSHSLKRAQRLRLWLRLARRRITLPVPVSLKRFAAPLWVFIFGMVAVVSSICVRPGAQFLT